MRIEPTVKPAPESDCAPVRCEAVQCSPSSTTAPPASVRLPIPLSADAARCLFGVSLAAELAVPPIAVTTPFRSILAPSTVASPVLFGAAAAYWLPSCTGLPSPTDALLCSAGPPPEDTTRPDGIEPSGNSELIAVPQATGALERVFS